MTQLSKGANLALHAASLRAVLTWNAAPGAPDVDASALLVDVSGKVRSPEDFVHLGHPAHPSGAVRHEGEQAAGGIAGAGLTIDLAALDPSVEKVVLTASTEAVFGAVQDLKLRLFDLADSTVAASFVITDADTETALVTGELYRHGGGWKFRAIGQGYASGLDGLAADYGITTPQETHAPPPADPYAQGAAPQSPPPYDPAAQPQEPAPQPYPLRPTAPYAPGGPAPAQPQAPQPYPPSSPQPYPPSGPPPAQPYPPSSPPPAPPQPSGPPPAQPYPPSSPPPGGRPTAPYPPGRPNEPY